MNDSAFTGTSRNENWRYDLLDLSDRPWRALDGISGHSLDMSIAADIGTSGSLNITRRQEIDWPTHHVRLTYQMEGQPDVVIVTGIPKVPSTDHDAAATSQQISIFDKTLIPTEDTFGVAYAVPAGTPIADKIREIIASTGDTTPVLGDTDAVLSTQIVWDEGVTKLRIINDLLSAANMLALDVDGLGYFTITPWIPPISRPVMWDFFDGEQGVFLEQWSRTRNLSGVPNRVVVVAKTEGDETPETATAQDEEGTDFSYSRIHRWITRTVTDVDAAAGMLPQVAARKLIEAQGIGETFTISHPWLPGCSLNAHVTFFSSRHMDVPADCVIQQQTWPSNGLIESTLRRIQGGETNDA